MSLLHIEPTTMASAGLPFFGAIPEATLVRRNIAPSGHTFAIAKKTNGQAKAAVFKSLCGSWKKDTQFVSDPGQKYLHPSYARIIGLGEPAVKFILQSMEKQYDDWFYALRAITGEDPVTADMAGDVTRMSDAWIQWGRAKGIL